MEVIIHNHGKAESAACSRNILDSSIPEDSNDVAETPSQVGGFLHTQENKARAEHCGHYGS